MTTMTTLARHRVESSRVAAEAFFEAHSEKLARACVEMARRFDRGGRLLVLGERAAASDAHHVAVEFVHPVLVGKRALPALAFTKPLDAGEGGWSGHLRSLARDADIVLAITHGPTSEAMSHALRYARQRGFLTLELSGGADATAVADFSLGVSSGDALVVQEVQETAYHVFWELIHVFLRGPEPAPVHNNVTCTPDEDGHCSLCGDEAIPGLVVSFDARARSATVAMAGAEREVAMDLVDGARVGDTVLVHQGFAISATSPAAPDPTRALYPFLYDDRPQAPPLDGALDEVRASTLAKCSEIVALREALFAEYRDTLSECAETVARRLREGGKLIAFGNGGSATDAEDAIADCHLPAQDGWRVLPALALTSDVAVLSAIANDVGFDNVFARQVVAFGEAGDVALGFSTSGNSPNVVAGLREAKRRGLLTIAMSGADGGELAREGAADYCFTARSTRITRIQEAHATVWHALLHLVQHSLA